MPPQSTWTVDAAITIRRAETPADYRACQDAQRRAWGLTEESYVVPIATMVGANLHGGLVLGAFHADGRAVGLSFGFLGRVGGRLCLYSQLTGVVPEYQSRGLGLHLKLAQRDFALAEGLSLIAWAFDPLQAGNAQFNLVRLGACVRHYIPNMYGERSDALNAGVPTDRLIAEWEIGGLARNGLAPSPEEARDLPRWIRTEQAPEGRRLPVGLAEVSAPVTLLEIPPRIASLRREHPAEADAWLSAVREAFQRSLAAGYAAVGVCRAATAGQGPDYYVLTRAAH